MTSIFLLKGFYSFGPFHQCFMEQHHYFGPHTTRDVSLGMEGFGEQLYFTETSSK